MVRKIKKILALILTIISVNVITPRGIPSVIANAATNDNNSQINLDTSTNNVTLASSNEEATLETVEEAMIPAKLNAIYSNVSTNATVSQFENCGTLSYTLDDSAAENIATILRNNMSQIKGGVTAVETGGSQLIVYGQSVGSQELIAKGTQLKLSAEGVLSELSSIGSLSDAELVTLIKTEAKDIPVYKYTVISGGNTVAQGFAAGGTLGLALNPVDTYNGIEKDAIYSSLALVPSLPLTGNSAYDKVMDLNASGINIICDGLNINIMDYTGNKVYAINNPVYNMLQLSAGAKGSTSKDILNVVDFSGVTNLKGATSSINLSSQGISTTVLSISLTTSDSKNKDYEYALPVEAYEKSMLDSVIDSLNLSTVGDTLKGMIKTGTYTMIPNTGSVIDDAIDSSGLGTAVNNVTGALNNVSDALNDLTDALEDKNNDVNDAWDKVFDRFNNDPGWGKKDGYRYYYDKDGVSLKGVQTINGKTYYFNRIDGAMETGWQIVDGKKCYFDKKKGYELLNQWIQDGEDWYFVGEDGAVKKMEWVNDGGKSYYLKSDGKMTRDWLKIEDYWYYFGNNGAMETSVWKWSNGKWYYLKDNGQAANNWLQLNDKWYYFKDPSGEMQTGWFRADGNWYCANDDGSMKIGWVDSNDGWCYLDDITGIMKKNEWATIDGKKYYFSINGVMVTGSRYIDGVKYVFNADGTLSE
ncbi:N-acetylmuramoyl-L-alanine amidase family protein [Clostridium sp.]|uniref:N-acetylmuramoyl-L-alanine amidase family protein n=1 Tax=Clostridium sp. TaxID=1506 RepID=UPI00260C84C5|nr:N-acetylmuramoyl-L-alanine amidase family protein [Clostridium sp.]